ncbi:MAG: DUF6786 family protein [Cyclobacteriaceae bacterium]
MRLFFLCILLTSFSCTKKEPSVSIPGSYSYDANFLRQHTQHVIELQDEQGKAKVLLSADYQGRVMTSSSGGDNGTSYGWLNYDLIKSSEKKKQFNPVGGEERFWLGPEGGQYSLYFHAGDSFKIANWQVPALIDTVTYEVTQSNTTQATFSKKASIINYSGARFDLQIERKISLLTKQETEAALHASLNDSTNFVAYQTENQIQNAGEDWTKENGLLSIWLLGMFTPSENTVVIIPFHPAPNAKELISTNYFGEIPEDRLTIKDSVLFFTCDGKYRSKLGLPPTIAKSIAASFDFQKNILTVISFELNPNGDYVNSKWEIQKEPYRGDAVNSYNDGPLADGSQLGPFYELESSSSALALKTGETKSYKQITFHAEGDFDKLNSLAKQLLGVDLNDLRK